MKKLIAMMMLLMLVGCNDREQQYIDNISQFTYKSERQQIKSVLFLTDSRHGYNTSDYFNDKVRRELADSMSVIDSLYIVLLDAPQEFKSVLPNIRIIYRDLKKFEDMLLVMYRSSPEYNSDMLINNLDSASAYRDRLENCIYNLKADFPQAFTNGKR